MKALILAGGLGTRLSAVVPNLPKPLASVCGRPFLEYLFDYWIEKGINEFYLSIGHLAEKIKDHFKDEYKGYRVYSIKEPYPLGTGGGIFYSLNHFKDDESDIVVLNGDSYAEVDFDKMKSFHREKKSELTLALREVEQNDRYSGVLLNSDCKIQAFKKREEKSPFLLINAGIYLMKPKVIKYSHFKIGDTFSIEDDFFPQMIHKTPLYGFVTVGKFIDIGIPKDYKRAQTFFKYAK